MPSGWPGHKERNSAIGTIDVRWWISCCRERISDELNRHQPLLGDCLSSFASRFSITFFEPEFNGDVKHTSNVSQLSPEAKGKSFRHEKEHRIASLRRCDDEHRAHYLTFDQSDRGDQRTCRPLASNTKMFPTWWKWFCHHIYPTGSRWEDHRKPKQSTEWVLVFT